jgi:hypothetical protein
MLQITTHTHTLSLSHSHTLSLTQGTLWGWVRDTNATPLPAEAFAEMPKNRPRQPDQVICYLTYVT